MVIRVKFQVWESLFILFIDIVYWYFLGSGKKGEARGEMEEDSRCRCPVGREER